MSFFYLLVLGEPKLVVLYGFFWLFSRELLLAGSRDNIGWWGVNSSQLCATHMPYLLYFCSSLSPEDFNCYSLFLGLWRVWRQVVIDICIHDYFSRELLESKSSHFSLLSPWKSPWTSVILEQPCRVSVNPAFPVRKPKALSVSDLNTGHMPAMIDPSGSCLPRLWVLSYDLLPLHLWAVHFIYLP